jgi:hypothetical protein
MRTQADIVESILADALVRVAMPRRTAEQYEYRRRRLVEIEAAICRLNREADELRRGLP